MTAAKRSRFGPGDVVFDRTVPRMPLFVLSADERGRLTVVDARGRTSTIGTQFVGDFVGRLCAAERALIAQRSELAALLQLAAPCECSIHARAQAALAPAPAPPQEQRSLATPRPSAPPPPKLRERRPPAKAKSHGRSSARPLFDLLKVLSIHDGAASEGTATGEEQ